MQARSGGGRRDEQPRGDGTADGLEAGPASSGVGTAPEQPSEGQIAPPVGSVVGLDCGVRAVENSVGNEVDDGTTLAVVVVGVDLGEHLLPELDELGIGIVVEEPEDRECSGEVVHHRAPTEER